MLDFRTPPLLCPHCASLSQRQATSCHLSTVERKQRKMKPEKQVRRHLSSPLSSLQPPPRRTRKIPPEITSSLRRLIITHNDRGTIHFTLKLIHHVENDIALIYHKIYGTCTFSNEIYANDALATVCVFKSFDREVGVQPSWRGPCPYS